MNKIVSGRFIRSWSCYCFLALVLILSLYLAIALQDLRPNLHVSNSALAKLNVLLITTLALTLPLTARFFIRKLAGALAGLLLSQRGYSVNAACILLSTNLGLGLQIPQFTQIFSSSRTNNDPGLRAILLLRLVSDILIFASVPFVSLAILIRRDDTDKLCYIAYDRAWLLFAILWPCILTLAALIYLLKFWHSHECIRTSVLSDTSAALQIAHDLGLVLADADGDMQRVSGRWQYGHRVPAGEDGAALLELGLLEHSFLGLVREEECASLTEMLMAMEGGEEEWKGGSRIEVGEV